MNSQTVEVILPVELLQEIDSLVGQDKRSAFLADSANEMLRRNRLRAFLASDEVAWKDENHPELAAMGTEAWVRAMRQEGEAKLAEMPHEE